jgi:hypothetical protein
MEFGVAFRRLLEDKLLRRGIAVSENSLSSSVVLMFDVQPFLYDHMGREVPLVLLPVAASFDDLASVYDTSRAEVLLTVSVSDGTYLRYSDSTEFYVRPSDLVRYSARLNGTPTGDRVVSHWVNDNPASGVRVEWHESDTPDGDHPSLAPFIIPAESAPDGRD